MKKIATLAFTVSIALATASSISAKKPHNGGNVCREYVKQYCADVEKGEGRILNCLNDNRTNLSSDCQANVDKRLKVYNACKADRETLCKDKQGRDLRRCMRQNRKNLSDECKNAIRERKPDRKKHK